MRKIRTWRELDEMLEWKELYRELRRDAAPQGPREWDPATATRAETEAKLREAERYAGGRKRTPFLRGGLPSLGKRRP